MPQQLLNLALHLNMGKEMPPLSSLAQALGSTTAPSPQNFWAPYSGETLRNLMRADNPEQRFLATYGNEIQANLRQMERHIYNHRDLSFFGPSRAPSNKATIPQDGLNRQKLKEIDYSGSIPKDYQCPLSMEIMTEPVYVRQHPNQRFEKSWILAHLQNRHDNPLTREHMTEADLIDDTALKSEINAFVEAQLNTKPQP